MILNRLGNKTKIALEIQKHFPRHDAYMEPFFGAGGMFFNKPMVKYNFLNDINEDVYNLFRQVIDNKDLLVETFEKTPLIEKQFIEWGKGKREKGEIMSAIRFMIISNYGLYGKPNTMRKGFTSPKNQILSTIDLTFDKIKDAVFTNCDFRQFFNRLDYKTNKSRCFCYCDPPYLGTNDNYSDSFNENDSEDLFQMLMDSGVRFAMSEFDHPFILKQAERLKLNITSIGERINLKNKRIEILVHNYDKQPLLFDL